MSLDNLMTKTDLDDYTTEVKEYVGGGIRNVYKSIGYNGAKNLLTMTVDGIKAVNTAGTWNGNEYSFNSGKFIILTDDNNNVTGIKIAQVPAMSTNILLTPTGNLGLTNKILSGGIPNSYISAYDTVLQTVVSSVNNEVTIPDTYTNYRILITVTINASIGVIYPMIRLASDTDPTFQPYTQTNQQLTDNLKSNFKASGDIVSITNAAPMNASEVIVDVEPNQDLHGYDHPWVGGTGKNLLGNITNKAYASISGTQNDEDGITVTNLSTDGRTSPALLLIFYNGNTLISNESVPYSGSIVDKTFTIPSGTDNIVFGHSGSSKDIKVTLDMTNLSVGIEYRLFCNIVKNNPSIVGGFELNRIMICKSNVTDSTYERYENICHFSGYDAVKLQRDAKNLINPNTFTQGILNPSDGVLENSSNWITTDYIKCKNKVVLQGFKDGTEVNFCVRFCTYDKFKNFISSASNYNIDDVSSYTKNIVLNEEVRYVRATFGFNNTVTTPADFFSTNRLQLELGSTTTAYEPYTGATYIIKLGDTYYGFRLSVTKGEIVVYKKYVDLGDLTWLTAGSSGKVFTTDSLKTGTYKGKGNNWSKEKMNAISSAYVADTGNNVYTLKTDGTIGWDASAKLYIYDTSKAGMTGTEFKTAVTGQQLAYELANPFTIQLNPKQIKLLENNNILYADAGDITVIYQPNNDLGKALIPAIESSVEENTLVGKLTDSEPYIFRQSKAIGDREYLDSITGCSLGWNQLVKNGDFSDGITGWASYNSNYSSIVVANNKLTATFKSQTTTSTFSYGVSQAPAFDDASHKYFLHFEAKSSFTTNIRVDLGASTRLTTDLISANTKQAFSTIVQPHTYNKVLLIYPHSGAYNVNIENQTLELSNIYLTDLTLMFGPSIADYVYSLEQATVGSGIAWLKSYGFFIKDYYPYNAGSIQSVNTSGHKMAGKNLLNLEAYLRECKINKPNLSWYFIDEELYINNINNLVSTRFQFAEQNIGVTFSLKMKSNSGSNNTAYLLVYDVSGIEVARTQMQITTSSFTEISVSGTAARIEISYGNRGAIIIKDIQVELGSNITAYEPYTSTTYHIFSTDLRGILKLDINNKLYSDGDIYNADGNLSRRYKIVNLGSLDWTKATDSTSGITIFYVGDLSGGKITGLKTGINTAICSKYITSVADYRYLNDKEISVGNAVSTVSKCGIVIRDSSYTDTTTFKTAMDGVYLVCELANPTTETVSPIQNPQICSPYGTEQFVDERDVLIPIYHSTEYYRIPDWINNRLFNSERDDTEYVNSILPYIKKDDSNNAGFHNSIYRGRDLETSVTPYQWACIENGTFEDLFIGDYWIINDITWRIAAFDYWMGVGENEYKTTKHHIVIVPDQYLVSGGYPMNTSETTAGGYIATQMHTQTIPQVIDPIVENAFGASHIMQHSEMITDQVTDGKSSKYAWVNDIKSELMNEIAVYGSRIFGSSGYDSGNAKGQLPLFRLNPSLMILNSTDHRKLWWLRDVYDAGYFCYVNGNGYADKHKASNTYIPIRPYFSIYQNSES